MFPPIRAEWLGPSKPKRHAMNSEIAAVQQRLTALGFAPGLIDGEYGPDTEAAVRAFQAARGLEVDGVAGPQTRVALGILVSAVGDPPWLPIARGHLGLAETKGPHHNPKVVDLWREGQIGGVSDDETPWCAAFVSAVLELAGVTSARSGWARSYLGWGVGLAEPAVGAVAVFERGPNAGHVGFVVGRDAAGHLMILGGNQGDAVTVRPFAAARVLGYRWPASTPLPPAGPLPLVASDGRLSTGES